MKAVITWPNGRTEFEDCDLGDARVGAELERLANAGVKKDVHLVFEDDFV